MIYTILNSVIVGIITAIFGSIILRVLLKKYSYVDKTESLDNLFTKYENNYIIEIGFFVTGVLIHLVLEYYNFNAWYCSKKCISENNCTIVCERI